ncbi:MAG TPA: hypothetical protein VGX50_18955 [Longimicrobium sp.]|jgi:hypothetical protein|nr:hypothetical protein [Longimicrobium sp.]
MKSAITQVPAQPWPSGYGEVIAMLDIPLERLAAQFSLDLFEGTDNLGDYRAAIVRVPSGRRLGLAAHDGAAEDGVEVHADQYDDPQVVLTELLQALELSEDVVTWLRDALVAPTPEAASRAH